MPIGRSPLLALDRELDRQAGGLEAARERADVPQRRLRRERELLVLAAEHAEQPADLGQRLAAARLDGQEGVAGADGVALGEPARPGGLHDHRAQRVGDDVVQLAGDPRALLLGSRGGPLGALVLEPLGLLAQRLVELRAVAQHAADQHRAEDQRQRGEDVVRRARRRSCRSPSRSTCRRRRTRSAATRRGPRGAGRCRRTGAAPRRTG